MSETWPTCPKCGATLGVIMIEHPGTQQCFSCDPPPPHPVQQEVAALKAEVARLTQERDEALVGVEAGKRAARTCAEMVDALRGIERLCGHGDVGPLESVRKTLQDLKEARALRRCVHVNVAGDCDMQLPQWKARAEAAEAERDDLRKRLDLWAEEATP